MPPDAFAGARSVEDIKAAFGFKLPSREEQLRKKAQKEQEIRDKIQKERDAAEA